MNTEHSALNFQPTPLPLVKQVMWLRRQYFDPRFFGLEHVAPDQPALYVGNHTIYGGLDVPLLYTELRECKGIILRGLGDSLHFKIPGWGELMTNNGVVEGTPENCHRLMDAGEHIMVFPGGAREAAKRKEEKYRLTWKTRTGFARIAMAHGYPIIPVAALGADDTFDIHIDAYDVKSSWLGRNLMRSKAWRSLTRNGDLIPPFSTGIGPTPIPRPERFYFSFGEPIPTAHLKTDAFNKEQQWQVRKQVMNALNNELERLKTLRDQDAELPEWRKILCRR